MHNLKSARLPERSAKADPVDALAIVIDNVTLPKSTIAALRLVCRATQLAVDRTIDELDLSLQSAEDLPGADRTLTSGLTVLRLTADKPTLLSVKKAYAMAKDNSNSLKHLTVKGEGPWEDSACRAALSALGGSDWPQLAGLYAFTVPTAFTRFIKIKCMPALADLELHGTLKGADVAALHRGARFCATIERLTLDITVPEDDPKKSFYNALKQLLQNTSKLRHLSLTVPEYHCRDLGFLSAELPVLESLCLKEMPYLCSLFPITSCARTSLETLHIFGGVISIVDMQAVMEAPFPALKDLLIQVYCVEWSCLRDLAHHAGLIRLSLRLANFFHADVAHVAAALAGLPLLESLCVNAMYTGSLEVWFEPEEAMQNLLSGPPLARLRRLVTGQLWNDSEDSIQVLADSAHKVPNLEELVMDSGFIPSEGIVALTNVGRAGQWPRLRLLQLNEFSDDHSDYASQDELETRYYHIRDLREAWPGAEIKIGQN